MNRYGQMALDLNRLHRPDAFSRILDPEAFFAEATVPPQFVGLFASAVGIVVGSLAPQLIRDSRAR